MDNLRIQKEDVKSFFQGDWQKFYSRYVDLKNGNGSQYLARCPFHSDSQPSLSIDGEEGIFHCFGCGASGDAFDFYGRLKNLSGFPETVQGIGASFNIQGSGIPSMGNSKRQIVATYDYTDETGKLLYQTVRYDPKDFRQRRPDGKGGYIPNLKGVRRVPYRLLDVLQADLVFVVEGEKDADALVHLGFVGTTCPMGAGKWQDEYSQSLTGKDVVLIPDNDESGYKHVEKIAESLKDIARSIKILELPSLPDKGDVSDWIQAGGTKEELERLIEECPSWDPKKASPNVGKNHIEWETPVLLDDFSLPDMEPVPGIIGKFSQAVSVATETPLELAVGMALATVATACQGKAIVQVKRGYSEPLNVWINAVLESGNRKSAVNNETTRPFHTWESQHYLSMEADVKEAESKRKNQESRLKSLRARYGKAKCDELDEIEEEIRELEAALVEVPVLPKVWVQDITPEHLGTMMAIHHEKMAIISAEGGIFDIISGRYSNGIPNLDLFLQSHSGDPVRVDRGSREAIYLEHPALTMGLSPQPEVLRSIAGSPGFRGRGLLARFLYLLPKSKLGHRTLETEPVPQHTKEAYEFVIHALLSLEPSLDERGKPVPHIISLTYAAYEEWLEFSRVVERDLREGGRFENITDWAGKLPGAAARIAGLLHCVEYPSQPWSTQISLETMQQALGLAAVFASHALKVFDLMGADKSLKGARKVWRWIKRGRLQSFKKNECYNALKGSFPRVADIEPPLDILEERNYISGSKEKTGGRPSITYTVNPYFTERWS